jgi:hypothetical protein
MCFEQCTLYNIQKAISPNFLIKCALNSVHYTIYKKQSPQIFNKECFEQCTLYNIQKAISPNFLIKIGL